MSRAIAPLLLLLAVSTRANAAPVGPSCIDSSQIQGSEGESDRTILFHMQGGKTWRNTLRGACPGLADIPRWRSLATEQQGTQLCRGDSIRAFDPQGVRSTGLMSYPRCPLGEFSEVPPQPKPIRR